MIPLAVEDGTITIIVGGVVTVLGALGGLLVLYYQNRANAEIRVINAKAEAAKMEAQRAVNTAQAATTTAVVAEAKVDSLEKRQDRLSSQQGAMMMAMPPPAAPAVEQMARDVTTTKDTAARIEKKVDEDPLLRVKT